VEGRRKELFFLSEGEMMKAKLALARGAIRASVPERLFVTGFPVLLPMGPPYLYDITPDGRRFVLLKPEDGSSPGLSVTVNWAAAVSGR
jgi:hypothetical protein